MMAQQAPAAAPAKPASNSGYRTRQQKHEEIVRRQKLKSLESEIAQLEEKITSLEEEITLPEVIADYQRMAEKCNELEQTKQILSETMDQWLELSE